MRDCLAWRAGSVPLAGLPTPTVVLISAGKRRRLSTLKSILKVVKPGDLVVLGLLIAVAVGCFAVMGFKAANTGLEGLVMEVRISGEVVYSGPLRFDEEPYSVVISLPGGGEANLLVEDGTVRMLRMPHHLCPVGICTHFFGAISEAGEVIVCVPNELIVELFCGRTNRN